MIRSDLEGERDGPLAVAGIGGDRECEWDELDNEEDDPEGPCGGGARWGKTREAGEGALYPCDAWYACAALRPIGGGTLPADL